MFKNVTGFNDKGTLLTYVDERFQYFQHYWSIVKHENREIFFDEIWFESHRTIITKIEYQIEHNPDNSYKWFGLLFLDHPFFKKSNIIANQRSIFNNCTKIQHYIDPTGTTSENQKKKNYAEHIEDIYACIRRIKSKLFDKNDYNKTLANHLTQILSDNSPLTDKVKLNIRFLVASFIVELRFFGYKLDYVEKIPDIILSRSHMYEFPYEKTIEDFDMNEEQYTSYKEEEKQDKSLKKCLSGLVNLINYPLKDGYYIFRVDNLMLINPHPITIGEVTFYNPQKTSMLNLSNADDEWKSRYIDAELFYSPLPNEEIIQTKRSTCNAIIKSKIRSHSNIESPTEFFYSFQTVTTCLEILNDIIDAHLFSSDLKGTLQIYKHIKLHGSQKMANFNFSVFHDAPRRINAKEKEINIETDFISRIDRDTKIGKKLFHIIGTHTKLKNNEAIFNFKDLWIAWESLLSRQQMKNFAKQIFHIRYKKHYWLMMSRFLEIKLSTHNMFQPPYYWTLTSEELMRVGLKYGSGKKRLRKKFMQRYHLIAPAVPIEIVRDIVKMIDDFIANQSFFLSKIDKWVENTIDEVYMERNMEVHKNLLNDSSAVKLKQDFLRISNALYYELVQFQDKRNPESLKLIMDRFNSFNKNL